MKAILGYFLLVLARILIVLVQIISMLTEPLVIGIIGFVTWRCGTSLGWFYGVVSGFGVFVVAHWTIQDMGGWFYAWRPSSIKAFFRTTWPAWPTQ